MNNMFFHCTDWIKQMCAEANIKFMYLSLYLSDLNLIEKFFIKLMIFIKWHWRLYEDNSEQEFDIFLEWCVNAVKDKAENVKDHLRHAEWIIDEL